TPPGLPPVLLRSAFSNPGRSCDQAIMRTRTVHGDVAAQQIFRHQALGRCGTGKESGDLGRRQGAAPYPCFAYGAEKEAPQIPGSDSHRRSPSRRRDPAVGRIIVATPHVTVAVLERTILVNRSVLAIGGADNMKQLARVHR